MTSKNLALVALLVCLLGAGGAWVGGAFNSAVEPKPDHLPTLVWETGVWDEAVWG
jgi:hypothetical protein